MAAVDLAKLLGVDAIAVGRSADKLAVVKDHGAAAVIQTGSARETVDGRPLRAAVKELAGGEGVDVVYDTVGGELGGELLRSLAFGGRYIVVGWASNVSESGGRATFQPDRLPTNIMQMKCLQVMGSPMVIYSTRHPEWRKRQLAQIFEWAGERKINPFVSHRFPMTAFREAAAAKFRGDVVGSCVMQL